MRRMRRTPLALFLTVTLLFPSVTFGQRRTRPRLVLLIVVDQFRYDYFERFGDLFVPNGLRRGHLVARRSPRGRQELSRRRAHRGRRGNGQDAPALRVPRQGAPRRTARRRG